MMNAIANGMSMKQAWNQAAGIDLIEAARAHVVFFTFHSFKEKVLKTKDTKIYQVLDNLCSLYGIHKILNHPVGLIECRYISPE